MLRINLVGAGRLANALGPSLQASGQVDIVAVVGRTPETAQQLASALSTCWVSEPAQLPKADVCLLAVPDDAIAAVAARLPAHQGLAAHTSGATPLSALEAFGGRIGVFWPMQSFSRGVSPDWPRIPLFIEAEQEEDLALLWLMAQALGAHAYPLSSADREDLHLAAVFASNFTNHMLRLAEEVHRPLAGKNVPFEVYRPLVEESLRKVFELGAAAAQTGPAVRGDTQTQERHLRRLEAYPDTAELYRHISRSIQAWKRGL